MTDRYLRRREVETMSGLSRATIYRHIKAGMFPRPRQVGPNSVRWRASDLERWRAGHPTTTEPPPTPS